MTGKLTTRQEKMDARAPGGAGVKKKKRLDRICVEWVQVSCQYQFNKMWTD